MGIMHEPSSILWSYVIRERDYSMLIYASWISGHVVWLCHGEWNLLMTENLLVSLYCLHFVLLSFYPAFSCLFFSI